VAARYRFLTVLSILIVDMMCHICNYSSNTRSPHDTHAGRSDLPFSARRPDPLAHLSLLGDEMEPSG